jgi:uncharacterized membrane protein YeaQ/YmgE (transglycosylase-associated protein family)
MEFAIALGITGWAVLLVGAFLFGVIAQFVGETQTGYEWLVDGIAAVVGAIFASEFIIGWRAVGPVFDGLAIVPAVVGGLVLGLVVEVATRFLTGGHYLGRPIAV